MKEPRVFYGWWQVLVAFLIQGVSTGAVMYTYSVAVVPFAETFQPSRMVLMLGVTSMTLVSGLLSPWLGTVIDRRPLRLIMLIGAIFLALGYAGLSFTTAMWQVLVVYAVFMSVAIVLLGPLSASTLLARWFTRRRGLALGIAAIGTSVGGFLFPPLLQWLIDSYEWRHAFRILAGVILLTTAPWILLLVVNRPADRGLQPDGATAPAASSAATSPPRFTRSGELIRQRNFWLIALVVGLLFSIYSAILSNLVPFALDRGISMDRSAFLLSLIALFGMFGKLVFGAVADHIDLRLGLACTLLLVAAGLICYTVADTYALLVSGSVALGLAAGGMLPVWGAMIGQVFGAESYGRAMGLMSPVIMPFSLLAPPLAGRIHDVTGSYNIAFMLFVGVLALALLMLPWIKLERPSPVQP